MNNNDNDLPISADLLAILRDPAAVQNPEKYGPDPGQLELVHNSWLVSKDTGYKYPIKDGIPVMLIEEGERWKDTPIDALPMPPESADPLPASESASSLFSPQGDSDSMNVIAIVAAIVGALVLFLIIWRLLTRKKE